MAMVKELGRKLLGMVEGGRKRAGVGSQVVVCMLWVVDDHKDADKVVVGNLV